ncbi:hypothetical protein [Devosia sp.]|uniref:hypothetical protein n=1 Tax=Devosia sp. TaxID=1871048 RepID=UPI003A942778
MQRKFSHWSFWPFYFFLLTACLTLQISGLSIGRWGRDAATLQLAIETGGRLGTDSAGDLAVAMLTPWLGVGPFPNLLATVFVAYVVGRLAFQGSMRELVLVLFLSFPMIYQLQFVAKESVVVSFAAALFAVFAASASGWGRAISVFCGLALMAMVFRSYYWVSLGAAVTFYLLGTSRLLLPALACGLVAAGLIEPVREALLHGRYLVHRNVSEAAVSLIPSHFSGHTAIDLVGGYVTSTFHFLTPLLQGVRVQEFYMQLYVVLAVVLCRTVLRHGDRAMGSAFLGIVCTFALFVAELGTLARHLSAVMPLAFMALYFAKPVEAQQNLRSDGTALIA